MSELKLPRLLAAAKEFNVGQETIIEYLSKKGFNKDDLKPTAKLSEEMYYALQGEFASDKQAKNKADLVEIPKSQQAERRKKDEEDMSFGKQLSKPVIKEEVVEVNVIEPVITPEPAVIIEPVFVAPIIVETVTTPEPAPAQQPAKVVPVEIPETKTTTTEENGVVKIEAPELEGPKILNKIDLSAIDSSTRPKKIVKQKEEETKPIAVPTVSKPIAERLKPTPTPTPVVVEQPKIEPKVEVVVEDAAPVIENIQADRLTGPKILGKISLPVDSDTRPKPLSAEERKKRKRIPVDNRRIMPNQQGGGGNNQPQGQGGGNNFQNRVGGNNQQGGGFNRGTGNNNQGGNTQQGGGFNRGGNNQGGGGFNRGGSSQGGGFNRGGNNRNNNTANNNRRDDKEINAKEIQDKIKETQAKLSGGSGKGKSLKAKYRRAKREEAAESANNMDGVDNKLQVTEFVTVSELANLMDVSFAEVIGKCMGLGIMVSINQRLDAEVIELVASEFNFEVEFLGIDDIDEDDDDNRDEELENNESRPPIVTIMGHVDHGKTSLLDYIRNANVVAGEAGGITQHIGAYEVTTATGKAITFLDTPGHEAFTAMRARGAKVTDIAVIVVAADDAVMPQTKEAISHAQAAGVPMIFAVNKIDKDGANPQKIYEQLAGMNILVESWGGKFQSQELSAKQGLNVDLLLEKILLEAELLELKANSEKEATGSIIEASLDKGRGYVATILVQNGTLRQGDLMVSGQYYGRIKAMFNERNQRIEEAGPSTPAVILGLNGAPQAGEKLKVFEDEAEAKEIATKRSQILREQGLRARKHITLDEIGRRLALGNFKELNVIIKGDVDGSVEALSDSLQKLSTNEIAVRVVHKAVGQISESDILLAAASDAIIIGFNVRPSSQASKLAENEGVQVKMYSIIYTAIDEIRSAMEGMLEPKVEEKEVATVEIREVYKFDKATVAGCYVTEGKIKRDQKIRVFRDGILVYPRQEGGFAELGSLKRFKDDVKEVNNGFECGLTVKGFADLNVMDTVIAYEHEEIKRTL
jgi:translation initiation factor IF-2